MEVFIGNLPAQATIAELHRFLGEIELHADFNCRQVRDAQHESYLFFIARTMTEDEGEALIDRLNGKRFLDKVVVARPLVTQMDSDDSCYINIEERRINIGGPGGQMTFDL